MESNDMTDPWIRSFENLDSVIEIYLNVFFLAFLLSFLIFECPFVTWLMLPGRQFATTHVWLSKGSSWVTVVFMIGERGTY
jgi:hypothetical protein